MSLHPARAPKQSHRDAVDALRDRIDQTLAAENGDLAALLSYAEPTFQERRDLARLRKERFTVNLIESLSV